jgi:hypothetical protein
MAEPKKKKSRWLQGCGCGCGLLILVLGVLGTLAYTQMSDADKQWPNLRESLHFVERPTEVALVVGFAFPFLDQQQYTLVHKENEYTVTLYVFGGSAEVEALFKTEGEGVEKLAIPDNAELGETDVQGRMVRSMTDTGLSIVPDGVVGPGIRIDISTETLNRVIEMRTVKDKDPVTDEQIQAFFDSFDVWHQSEP